MSVSALALSPLARGLFQKVIIQSGVASSKTLIVQNPETYLYRWADQVGCKPRFYFPGATRLYHENIRDCLMRLDASKLTAEARLSDGDFFATGLFAGGFLSPTVDGEVLPRMPRALLSDENYLRQNGVLDRSYVIGVTNNDAGLMADIISFIPGRPYFLLTDPSRVAERVKAAAKTQFEGEPSKEMLNVIDFVYTYPRNPDGSIPLQNVMDLTLDGAFLLPSLVFARALADKAPVYFYLFDHYPQLKSNSLFKGTSHAMDNIYLFDRPEDPSINLSFYANVFTAESEPIPAVYRSVLTSFAKNDAPTFTTASSTSAAWPRYDSRRKAYLAISTEPEVRTGVYAQRVSLWLDFLPKLARTSGFFSTGSGRAAYD
ncbi:carboxylic ester hydrolase [Elysia marginata]|uniref:Carboxylic ester hydrolase n=1 Tax=Elysia marginata TaxID=1093978 RepID=A0AAV4HS67_9GAST|nr:carboxylic ester hydrolase [Elysia marginata]